MEQKSAKDRVKEKFDIASDLKKAKIETSIDDVKMNDGKITAKVRVSGLPKPEPSNSELAYESSYRVFDKVFDNFDEFSSYAKDFLEKTDEEIISLARGN
jgi:hypothetical protein